MISAAKDLEQATSSVLATSRDGLHLAVMASNLIASCYYIGALRLRMDNSSPGGQAIWSTRSTTERGDGSVFRVYTNKNAWTRNK